MAGFRLAPVAARRRRNPWQRRKLVFPGHDATFEATASDGFTITDSVSGNSSSGTASGGLFFLFVQGAGGASLGRTVSDGFTITDSASRVLAPVSTNSYSRTVTDGFTLSDAASGSVVAGSSTPSLIGVELEFTAILDVELSFVGE